MNIILRGLIQFAKANSTPAIIKFRVLGVNEIFKAIKARKKKGISVPAGKTTNIFEYVKQNKKTDKYAVLSLKKRFARKNRLYNIPIFNRKLDM